MAYVGTLPLPFIILIVVHATALGTNIKNINKILNHHLT
jgi:hypothetical protein